ncbi:hypothetical protein FJY84_00795, partial [Candidatus Bathyarchaeota archaeon]|nr:hypothetical protein [Candidatus Bathyarchaeota archaeon]
MKLLSDNIQLSVRDLILTEISESFLINQPKIVDLSFKIREDMCFFPMSKHDSFKVVAGVDAGSQILPLAAQSYGIISALCYQLP